VADGVADAKHGAVPLGDDRSIIRIQHELDDRLVSNPRDMKSFGASDGSGSHGTEDVTGERNVGNPSGVEGAHDRLHPRDRLLVAERDLHAGGVSRRPAGVADSEPRDGMAEVEEIAARGVAGIRRHREGALNAARVGRRGGIRCEVRHDELGCDRMILTRRVEGQMEHTLVGHRREGTRRFEERIGLPDHDADLERVLRNGARRRKGSWPP
jgi:hypothetical protein